MAVKKRGRPATGKAVPVTDRVSRYRQRIKKEGSRRVDLYLTAPADAALKACLEHHGGGSPSDLIETLLLAEWRKVGGRP